MIGNEEKIKENLRDLAKSTNEYEFNTIRKMEKMVVSMSLLLIISILFYFSFSVIWEGAVIVAFAFLLTFITSVVYLRIKLSIWSNVWAKKK
ncbi:hypothetical protein GKR75_07855 [Providencia sp. wls1919]|nr:hypothetical protein [Providencia sp. wls1919]